MCIPALLPTHDALLVRARPGLAAFVQMLTRTDANLADLALFVLDLRSAAGLTAGASLLGGAWVERRLTSDALPVVVVPLAGAGDIAAMVHVVAPSLVGIVGRRPTGTIEVVLIDEKGEAAMTWPDPQELLGAWA
jgi:hypothetical protein